MENQEKGMEKAALRYLGSRYFQQNHMRNYFAVAAVSLTSVLFAGGFTMISGIIQAYLRFQMTHNRSSSGSYYDIISFLPAMLIFFFLIMAAGYFTIYNIFSISVLQDIKFYGLLGTIGAEPRHIRYFMYLQADKIAIRAIPIGTAVGFLIGNLLIPIVLEALGRNFNQDWEYQFSFHPLIFFFSVCFSYLTLRLSCSRPGKIAAGSSSVEAAKYQEHTKKANKKTTGKRNRKEDGKENRKENGEKWDGNKRWNHEKWEGRYDPCFFMALKNIYRSPKKTWIMTISLSAGMILFMASYTLLRGISIEKYIRGSLGNADFFLTSENHSSGDSAAFLDIHSLIWEAERSLENASVETAVSEIGCVRMHLSFENREGNGILDTKRAQEYLVSNQLLYDDAQGNPVQNIPFFMMGMAPEILEGMQILEGNFDKEGYGTGKYIVLEEDEDIGISRKLYRVGDKVAVCGKEYEIMAVVRIPQYLSRMWKCLNELLFIFPEGEVRERMQYFTEKYIIDGEADQNYIDYYEDYKVYGGVFYAGNGEKQKLEQALDTYVKSTEGLVYYSQKKLSEELQSAYKMFLLILGALCILFGTIAAINAVNSIIVGIFFRKKMFTMLKNIGMEEKQQIKILLWEGVFYITAMLIVTITVGSGLSYFVLRNRCIQSNFMVYHYSVFPVIFLSGGLLAAICMISEKAYRGMKIYK